MKIHSEKQIKTIFSNTSWLSAEMAIRMPLSFFVGVLIARYMGPEEYGSFNYAKAFVGLFLPVASLGLDNVVIKYLVQHPAEHYAYVGTVFFLKVVAGLVAYILLFGLAVSFNDQPLKWHLIVIVGMHIIVNPLLVIKLYYDSIVKSKYYAISKMITMIVFTLIRIALVIFAGSVYMFAVMISAEVMLTALILFGIYLVKGNRPAEWKWDILKAKMLIYESWPLIIAGISIAIYMKLDQVMIEKMVGSKEVGWYSVAVTISDIWYFIPMILMSTFSPYITKAKMKNEKLYQERLLQILRLMVLLGVTITVPVAFLAPLLITNVFGSQYVQSASVLHIHIWSSIFVFIGIGSSSWFVNEKKLHISLLKTVAGAVLNVILNFIMIPRLGIAGAAYATIISQAATSVFANAVSPVTRSLFLIQMFSLISFPFIVTDLKQAVKIVLKKE